MEIKGILEKIRQSKKEEKKECFWALEIGFSLVKSAIWTVENDLVKVLSLGEIKQWQSEEELLQAIDTSLSSATENLETQNNFLEPDKVVLGLVPNWIKENKIVPEKIKLLKKISKELELDLVGFVVIEEAVVHQLKSIEGIPSSAILVYLENLTAGRQGEELGISLVNLGKVMGSEKVTRSGDLGADLIEGLSRIKIEGALPARIVIYGFDGGLEEARQEIVNYSWQKANFLHLPKTEILDSDFDIRAVVLAGGREIAGTTGLSARSPVDKEETTKVSIEEKPVEEESAVMGFVRDRDVAEKKVKMKLPPLKMPKISFAFLPRFWAKAIKIFPRRIPLVISLVVVILVILAGILAAVYWFLPHAEIVLLIKPQILEKEFSIKLDPNLDLADKENLALPAKKVETTLEGQKTITTTGTKIVGEKAKGEVFIYNGTSQEKVFETGTVITSASGIKFTLGEDVTVASQSGTAADPTPGKASVNVAAVEIGTEGNLVSGTEFTLANYSKSDYVAKNDAALTGGTSREVQVVSSQDRKDLLADLTSELEGKSVEELSAKLEAGQELIEKTLNSQVASQDFDKKVEEEATEVTLNLKLKLTALSFREAEFKDLIGEGIKAAVPDGFEYKPEENETTFELNKVTDDDVALFSAFFKTKLIPIYDLEKIKNNLSGKNMAIGQAYLNNLPHVDSSGIKITPKLPDRLVSFPRLSKNIKIEVRIK